MAGLEPAPTDWKTAVQPTHPIGILCCLAYPGSDSNRQLPKEREPKSRASTCCATGACIKLGSVTGLEPATSRTTTGRTAFVLHAQSG